MPSPTLFIWGTKQPLCILGWCNVEGTYNHMSATLPVIVGEENSPSLFGRNWFTELEITVRGIRHITENCSIPLVSNDPAEGILDDATHEHLVQHRVKQNMDADLSSSKSRYREEVRNAGTFDHQATKSVETCELQILYSTYEKLGKKFDFLTNLNRLEPHNILDRARNLEAFYPGGLEGTLQNEVPRGFIIHCNRHTTILALGTPMTNNEEAAMGQPLSDKAHRLVGDIAQGDIRDELAETFDTATEVAETLRIAPIPQPFGLRVQVLPTSFILADSRTPVRNTKEVPVLLRCGDKDKDRNLNLDLLNYGKRNV
uniref:Uncharacterized protein n=1 Tax=Timema bartmani TaxID=61472 RepID=A0A7R9EVI6_9NEOP|nr:unnamed protein product [Timema bartmani]